MSPHSIKSSKVSICDIVSRMIFTMFHQKQNFIFILQKVQDKYDVLNELSRNKSNQNLAIQKKYPHIQEIQHENRELRACLQDYQRTIEHVMTKYREHTQQKIMNSKFTFTTNAVSACER